MEKDPFFFPKFLGFFFQPLSKGSVAPSDAVEFYSKKKK